MKIEEIKTGGSLQGIEPTALVIIVAVVPISLDTIQLIYKTPDGTLKDRLLGRHDELAVEAKRIDLAFLFDPMMAVHTSNVEPLPASDNRSLRVNAKWRGSLARRRVLRWCRRPMRTEPRRVRMCSARF